MGPKSPARARRLPTVLLALAAVFATAADARVVTDSAGRAVNVPEHVGRVFAAGPPAAIALYVLAPHTLAGWPREPRADERAYLAAPWRDLPATGRLTGRGGTASLERLVQERPDLVLDFGSTADTYVSLADRVQQQTGIPYLLIDGRFEHTPAALRLLGEVLGVRQRGERLAREVEQLFQDLDRVLAGIPPEARPRVYLARGPDGLETGLAGSINTEIIERAGGRNVADPGGETIRRGLVRSSIENIILANPDTIITWDEHFFDAVSHDPLWQDIEAVRRGRVYLAPVAPFGWIDRPPSINRVIGLRWLANLFYPDHFPLDLAAATEDFYRTFYHVELSATERDALIQWANRQPGE